jgi:hypothetical protein
MMQPADILAYGWAVALCFLVFIACFSVTGAIILLFIGVFF